MKQESNRNGKFKEWREVKVIENEHICKNLVLHIQFCKIYFQFYFLVLQCLSVFIIEFGQVNTGWKDQEKWKIYVFFTFNLLVPLFRPSRFRMVLFFYISIYVSSQRRSSVRKGIFKNFTKFTGKHQFWSLFFINLQAMFSYEIMKFFEDFLNTYFEEHLNNCL